MFFAVLQTPKLTNSHPQFPSLPSLIPSGGEFFSESFAAAFLLKANPLVDLFQPHSFSR
jgi:hypothetical protein